MNGKKGKECIKITANLSNTKKSKPLLAPK
jgi:hypothetical protein